MAGKQKLTDLSVREVSLVDYPANKGARVMLFKRAEELPAEVDAYMKREFTDDERKALTESGAAMPDGSFPIENEADLKNAVQAFGRAKDQAAAKKHIITRARALGCLDALPEDWNVSKKSFIGSVMDAIRKGMPNLNAEVGAQLEAMVAKAVPGDADGDVVMFSDALQRAEIWDEWWDATNALQASVCSIVGDDDVTDKAGLLSKTLEEFTNHIQQLVGTAIAKSGGAQDHGEGEPMSTEALKKALGLADTATDADVTKAIEDAAFGAAVAKMSSAHTGFMNNEKAKMPSGGKKAFADMTAAERDAHMEKNPVASDDDGDEPTKTEKLLKSGEAFRTPEGVVITKAQVGGSFDVLKAQNDRLVAQGAEIEKGRDERELGVITKRVEPLTFIGKADEIGALLHSIHKLDPKIADAVEKKFEQLNEAVSKGKLFDELGDGRRGVTKALDAITAKAEELRKANPGWSIEKARTEARTQNPDLAKQEQEERAAAAR